MSDDELIEEIRLLGGYLLAHNRLFDFDHVREVMIRWAKSKADLSAARAEANRLRGACHASLALMNLAAKVEQSRWPEVFADHGLESPYLKRIDEHAACVLAAIGELPSVTDG